MTESLLVESGDGLCTLTLNRPAKHNALDVDLFDRLEAALTMLESKADAIGCVILQANGTSFCAGADLTAIAGGSASSPTFRAGVVQRLSRLPQIVVAKVHGMCVTGGLELILAADIIVASHSARFADTHARWGLVAGWGMTQRLPRRIGPGAAKLMMTTARFVDAREAHRLGLVDLLIPDDRLDEETTALAHDILAGSRHTNRATKALLAETDGMRLGEGLAHEHDRHPGRAPDYRERVARFSRKA